MPARRVIVVGAGAGGLAAACELARAGCDVLVLERQAAPGGKMRQVEAGGAMIDAGPTVFTMRWVFERIFGTERLEEHVPLRRAGVLARHAWRQGGRLDLFADPERSAEAIGDFAGAASARLFRDFCARAARMHDTLLDPFMNAQRPGPVELVRRVGWRGLPALWATAPWATMWQALAPYFPDPRLRQLFGRYATYCGASPFAAPATLMLVAHVEQQGVWLLPGGMKSLAAALAACAEGRGARLRYDATVKEIRVAGGRAAGVELASGEVIEADAVVFNGDVSALGTGLLGPGPRRAARGTPPAARSLSAITWCARAVATGFPLHYHNVFFAEDYAGEFDAVFRRREICAAPTVYLCAQDRLEGEAAPTGAERMLLLINAPADGDRRRFEPADYAPRVAALLGACGLELDVEASVTTGPDGFEALFPASGGALYGRAGHGARATFQRPGAETRLPGLYCAGGSVHPGPGVPMAALSGLLAAERVLG